MKKIIRHELFESNSSSTHSICICTDRRLLEKMGVPQTLYFGIGDHGWERESLTTPEEKANYLYTAILCMYCNDEKKKNDAINTIYENMCEIEVNSIFEAPEYSIYDNYKFLDNGSFDHVGEAVDFVESVLRNKKLLYSYLFSKYSYVEKGNDNSSFEEVYDIKESYDHKEFYKGN